MTAEEILALIDLDEGDDREFKSAKGGFPGSFWETYSAMANSEGGTIILGVEEKQGKFTVSGLDDPHKAQKTLWDSVNNKEKVSRSILTPSDVRLVTVEGKAVLVTQVRRATRKERPLYCGRNPIGNTYRRNYEGDYKCSDDEVGRMLADQSEEPADSRILEGFTLDDLDLASLQQYRNRFSARDPDHPWLTEDNLGLLKKLGGWRQDRVTGNEGLTVAGLLMFGKDEAIRDPSALPNYHVDYQEKTSENLDVRWVDRLYPDGKWCANLFQFYQLVLPKLTQGLKVPFQLGADLQRRDETPVHEAIREALVNALIHADYHGTGGTVIVRDRGSIRLDNPGSLLVSIQQLREGGVSECRNKSLQQMFLMIGGAEKAGSGIDKILKGWQSQHWVVPYVSTSYQPDRVRFILPFTSFIPEDSKERLRDHFGDEFDHLAPEECLALVLAETEGQVSNARLQLTSQSHPADLSKMLRGLVKRGFLTPTGEGRSQSYALPRAISDHPSLFSRPSSGIGNSGDNGRRSAPTSSSSGDNSVSYVDKDLSYVDKEESSGDNATGSGDDWILQEIAAEARTKQRLGAARMESIILRLCQGQWLTISTLAQLVGRDAHHIRGHYLKQLVKRKQLQTKYPDKPNHPDQAYRTSEVHPE